MIPQEFIDCPKAFCMAPAGFGKTHAIAACIPLLSNQDKQILILTHTHAGIASIKKKLKNQNVDYSRVNIDTISGFSQRYVLSFCQQEEIGSPDESSFFDNVKSKAISVFNKRIVQKIFSRTYSHLIVDEYQDCTKKQHQLIETLATLVPVHLFGDPLQGIFNFDKTDRSVEYPKDFNDFKTFYFLQTPHRWYSNNNSKELGDKIKALREELEEGFSINIQSDENANFEVYNHGILNPQNEQEKLYTALLDKIREESTNSILILMPSYVDEEKKRRRGHITERSNMLRRFDYRHEFELIEALDDKKYYDCAKSIDDLIEQYQNNQDEFNISDFSDILNEITLNEESISYWFASNHLINKRDSSDQDFTNLIREKITSFANNPNCSTFNDFFSIFFARYKNNFKRPDVAKTIAKSLKDASFQNTSVHQATIAIKSRIRRNGRKIEGKCFGTTLLTKGLEFDTVIVLYTNRIEDKMNFYVAISRACKKLILFTEHNLITFADR